MRHRLLPVAFLLAACGASDEADGPPRVSGAAYEASERPYDPTLDARAAIDSALGRARAENKLVLVSMGGNWCPDCRVLDGMMEIDALAEMLDREFVTVKVDVGQPLPGGGYEKNLAVAERFGAGGFEGVPTLLIVTPSGRLLNPDDPSIFRNARDRDPQDFADYLHRYVAARRDGGA